MGLPSSFNGAHLLQLLQARLDGQDVDLKEAGFARNACANYTPEERAQALEHLSEARKLLQGNVAAAAKLEALNIYLQSRTVFVGSGTSITLADLGMFIALRDSMMAVPEAEQEKLPNVFRWFDYVQNKDDVREVYGRIPIKKADFSPPNWNFLDPNNSKPAATKAPDAKGATPDGKLANDKPESSQKKPESKATPAKPESNQSPANPEEAGKVDDKNPSKQEKEKKEKAPAVKKEVDLDISVLDICVGLIKKVWKHPSADSLYVEEIDVGEPQPRQVVSGLVKYVAENEMLNRRVLVLLNIKAGKVRDVLSSGVVLCASNEDHTVVEPVSVPEGVPVGERVKFAGHDGKPEDVLNPKKKQWEKIAPELRTDSQGVANYQGVPFQTSAGVCKSSIVNGSIK